MTEQDHATLPGADRQEVWFLLSKPRGSFRDLRIWLRTFGIFPSAEHAMGAVTHKAETDPEFRRQSRGLQFAAVRMDWYVEITETGSILQRFRNEVGTW